MPFLAVVDYYSTSKTLLNSKDYRPACLHLQFLLRFSVRFFLLIDVNEWINNECAGCMLRHLNICDWFTCSHPSKGEHRTRNRIESCKCKRALLNTISDQLICETQYKTRKSENVIQSSGSQLSPRIDNPNIRGHVAT